MVMRSAGDEVVPPWSHHVDIRDHYWRGHDWGARLIGFRSALGHCSQTRPRPPLAWKRALRLPLAGSAAGTHSMQ
jgi:hypothetical protein